MSPWDVAWLVLALSGMFGCTVSLQGQDRWLPTLGLTALWVCCAVVVVAVTS